MGVQTLLLTLSGKRLTRFFLRLSIFETEEAGIGFQSNQIKTSTDGKKVLFVLNHLAGFFVNDK
jgi:hypothetical protein